LQTYNFASMNREAWPFPFHFRGDDGRLRCYRLLALPIVRDASEDNARSRLDDARHVLTIRATLKRFVLRRQKKIGVGPRERNDLPDWPATSRSWHTQSCGLRAGLPRIVSWVPGLSESRKRFQERKPIMTRRYQITQWDGDSSNVFYIVDSTAPLEWQPVVIARYRNDRAVAERVCAHLNRRHEMRRGK